MKSLLFTLFSAACVAAYGQSYTVQYMGMSQTQSGVTPLSMNDMGQVTGSFFFPSTTFQAFRWTNGAVENLGSLNGQTSHGMAINNQGFVVGYSDQNGAPFTTRGFKYGNSMVEIPPIDGRDTEATAVNNNGVYVGGATKTEGSSQRLLPAWFFGGAFVRLPVLTAFSAGNATGINDAGVVIGGSSDANGNSHAVRWVNGQIQDLGFIAGRTNANARDITSSGTILVQQTGGGFSNATLWSNGSYQDLGLFGASKMNDAGLIIGQKVIDGVSHSLLRKLDGQLLDLEPFVTGQDLKFFQAMDINNLGQIVGVATRNDNNLTEFIILNPVPEPATMVAVGAGILALARRRKRR